MKLSGAGTEDRNKRIAVAAFLGGRDLIQNWHFLA